MVGMVLNAKVYATEPINDMQNTTTDIQVRAAYTAYSYTISNNVRLYTLAVAYILILIIAVNC